MKDSPQVRWSRLLVFGALLLAAIVAWRQIPGSQPAANPVRPRPVAAATSATPTPAASLPAPVIAIEAPLGADQFLAFVQPANAPAITAALHSPATTVRYVRINRQLIEGKQSPFWQPRDTGRVVLPLPDGGTATVVIEESESLGVRRFTSVGKLEGRPESRAIFAYSEGQLHAHLEDPELGAYELRAATDDVEQFYKVDAVPARGGDDSVKPVIDADAISTIARRKAGEMEARPAGSSDVPPAPVTEASTAGANVRIDIMMLYTQAVQKQLTGTNRVNAVQSACDAAVAQLNSDLQGSLCQTRVRLVRIAEVAYPNDSLSSVPSGYESTLLDAVRQTTDGSMDEIHALRDQCGADLVCLVHNAPDPASIGIAYLFPVDDFGSDFNALFGFSVVEFGQLTAEHAFAHEIGHNLGCAHNRENASSQGAFSYSYGYRYTSTDGRRYRDIMSYDASPGYAQRPFFSTPLVVPPGSGASPIGIAAGSPGEADNARTIDQDGFEVSSFRLQIQAPANSGILYAVSTRAFVGAASDQQLIGGFIVTGAAGTSKRMLLRGNGPSLASALPHFLPDPKLTLFQLVNGSFQFYAENDDWGTNANAAAIATSGGTSAAPGSRDAALLLDLPPGTYTANITSADGSTGVALVEAYEVGASSDRIFALSTRGYTSSDQIMIAGFIVNATPGTTKRIVIRGQGPSLARAPFNIAGAMDDPFLELFNSTGDRIMLNDDWTLNRANGDDFQPLAQYYDATQIAAAGMAPANRREPCIMVDLPPGLYTAFLKPFEDLTTNPPQVAKPGVGLVEVYEIP